MLEFRIWDTWEKQWDVDAMLENDGSVRVFKYHELETETQEDYQFMLFTGKKDSNGNKIYDGDIIKDKEGNLYILEFNYLEFTLRDVTSENPKYDDDVEHEYNYWHNEPFSRFVQTDQCTVVGNIKQDLTLILNS